MGVAFALGLWITPCGAQDWSEQVRSLGPADPNRSESAVLDNLENRAKRVLGSIQHAENISEARQARPDLRDRLRHSLGLDRLPWPPNLETRVVGVLQRDGYRIEKIVYQTLPGMLVPAHLYVPDGLEAPAPAILFYPGHWWPDSKTRPNFQAFCINMAKLGFVVLTFDPFGQGERGVSSRDHRRTESLLVGISQQGFAEYDTQCAIEYLLSRMEVDPERIGITGASGGGYNTWITTALDDRIRVAVPVVGTSEFYEQIHVTRPLDWYAANEHCHFVADLIRYANNHEWLAMTAPRAVLMIAASEDQSFPVAGVREVYDYGRRLYESEAVAEKIGLFLDSSTGHGYQQEKREAAYGWFLKWLMNRGDGRPHPEPLTETLPHDSPELRCFPPGANEPAGSHILAQVQHLAADLPPKALQPGWSDVLGALPADTPLRLSVQDVPLQRLEIPSEPDLDVPAFLLRPTGKPRGLLLAVGDAGKEAFASDSVMHEAWRQGWVVYAVDPRGIGELRTSKPNWIFAVSLLLGENFVWRQAWDLSRAIKALSAVEAFQGLPIGVYAKGHNAALAATYAMQQKGLGSRLAGFVLRDGFLSFRQFIERPGSFAASFQLRKERLRGRRGYDREIPPSYFVFNGLRAFDLPDLLAAPEARGMVVNPINGDWERMSVPAASRMLPKQIRVVARPDPEDEIMEFLASID